MTEPLDELAAHAHHKRVVVVGGGIAGLVAAWECAKVGLRVTVVEASEALGGVVRSADVASLTLDVGAESYATRGGHVRRLIDELGLADAIVAPSGGRAWVAGLPGGRAAPLPTGGVLGIPDNPWQPDVRRIIGWSGAWRAYLDRLRPPLTIGHEQSLGALVRTRMGAKVLDRLVAPVTTGVYSARPDDIDVDVAAPGLNSALTRAGSLSGAVTQLRGGHATAPGGAVESLVGGMSRLVVALRERLAGLGVEILLDTAVSGIVRRDGGWEVVLEGGDGLDTPPSAATRPTGSAATRPTDAAATRPTDPAAARPTGSAATRPTGPAVPAGRVGREAAVSRPDIPGEGGLDTPPAAGARPMISADAVIVAVSEPAARRLLAPVVPGLAIAAEPAPVVEIVTLVLEASALDTNPRGTGVLTVPGSHRAKALTHVTAKWEWVSRAAGTGVHVLRVSFGAQGEAPATADLDDRDATAMALTEASTLLGVPLEFAQLRGSHRIRYMQSQPAATIGRHARVAADRAAIATAPGLAAVGAWLAGTGLAQVVPDAITEADRVRRAALFGDPSRTA